MEDLKRKKALLKIKIVFAFAIIVLVSFICIVIIQTVQISQLQNQIIEQNEYDSEVSE